MMGRMNIVAAGVGRGWLTLVIEDADNTRTLQCHISRENLENFAIAVDEVLRQGDERLEIGLDFRAKVAG